MPRSKSDTIEAMGLENFINTRYSYLEEKFGMKPFKKYLEVIHLPDTQIAEIFSTEDRTITPQQIGNWRRVYAKGVK